jgi:hypothetical protein
MHKSYYYIGMKIAKPVNPWQDGPIGALKQNGQKF